MNILHSDSLYGCKFWSDLISYLLFDSLLQAVADSSHELSSVCENLDIDLGKRHGWFYIIDIYINTASKSRVKNSLLKLEKTLCVAFIPTHFIP